MKRWAIAIDDTHIYVECKAKNRKDCPNGMGYHIHGNPESHTNNRESGRCGHCSVDYDTIVVDDETHRGTLVKIISKGKRKGMYIFEK